MRREALREPHPAAPQSSEAVRHAVATAALMAEIRDPNNSAIHSVAHQDKRNNKVDDGMGVGVEVRDRDIPGGKLGAARMMMLVVGCQDNNCPDMTMMMMRLFSTPNFSLLFLLLYIRFRRRALGGWIVVVVMMVVVVLLPPLSLNLCSSSHRIQLRGD
mmetsp:Transcript_31196/g.50678  ORF Transcript_31196/g.50678 Transcript_31196/m.50678 type:complete len:159 (+) Transcript_31196:170-646(+)